MPRNLIDTTSSTSGKTLGIEYYKRKQFPFAFFILKKMLLIGIFIISFLRATLTTILKIKNVG